jgi:16S rRNA (cytosine967-C5)-methyltransferase
MNNRTDNRHDDRLRSTGDQRTHAAAWVLAAASRAVAAVVHDGRSADAALAASGDHEQRRAINAVTLGTLRWLLRYQHAIHSLLARDPAAAPPLLTALLHVAVHQLEMSRNPRESTVSAAVDAARLLGLKRAAGLVNAVLRRWLRERAALQPLLDADLATRTAHPRWFVRCLEADWPAYAAAILEANNAHPPLSLRVNLQRTTVAAALAGLLAAELAAEPIAWLPGALTLAKPVSVRRLSGFAAGELSVQDAGAQLAAQLLAPRAGEHVLDACAAPGGKTGALLELAPTAVVTAVDIDSERLALVADNLRRLGQQARLEAADLEQAGAWQTGQQFDAILLDAPCSATGVIRRHPDIKLLRRESDIASMAERQRRILVNVWQMLRPGGRLLYVTCSVVARENDVVVGEFLEAERTAREQELPGFAVGAPLRRCRVGWQLLPGGSAGADGFYYALLMRTL